MKNFETRHFDKTIGETPEHKENFERWIVEKFQEGAGEEIKELELEKSEKDIEMIRFAEEEAAKVVQRYGRKKDVELPMENIHLLPEDGTREFTEGRQAEGAYSTKLGSMLIDRSESDIKFTMRAFHEYIHAKSYIAMQVTTEGEYEDYRSGFSVRTRDGKEIFFADIDEGVTTLLEQRFFREVISEHELFQDELKSLKEEPISRVEELENVNSLIDELWETNQDEFKNREEIVDIFVDAQINGHLVTVGRLIDKTFGEGTFRQLGERTGYKEGEGTE